MLKSHGAFRRVGVVLLLLGWFVYNAAVLLIPCISVQSVHEEGVALSRLDHAWLLFSHPEWIWEQWTHGQSRIQLLDRLPAILLSIACATFYTALGAWTGRWLRFHLLTPTHRVASVLFWFLLGYCCCGTFVSIANFVWPFQPLSAIAVGIVLAFSVPVVFAKCWNIPELRTEYAGGESESNEWMRVSWQRRLTGLFYVGSGLLLLVQALGAWLPTLDQEVLRDRWSQVSFVVSESPGEGSNWRSSRSGWMALEDVAMFGVRRSESARVQRIERSAAESPEDSMGKQNELAKIVKNRYIPVISAKWLAVLALDAGVILVSIRIASLYGSLVAVTASFFLLSFPSWMELIRLGRPEVIYGAACLGCVYVWLHPNRSVGRRVNPVFLLATCCLIGPVVFGLVCNSRIPADSPYEFAQAALRFSGFSFLYSIPWAATCLLGCVRGGVAPRSVPGGLQWGGISALAFLLFGGMLSQPDRVWIPFTVFSIVAFAVGSQSLLSMRGGWLWLLVWGALGFGSFLNVLAQPGWDNRLLGSLDGLLFEGIDIEGGARNEDPSRYGYSRELLRQTIAGDMPVDARILLVGHWDGLEIPQRTFVERVQSERIALWSRDFFERTGVTHIAVIDSSERGFSEWDETLERECRLRLEMLAMEGVIAKLPVSRRSRDLTLFQVSP